ncbi:terminal uridylyltransferase 7 [Rhinatrema bivittatum]|uniref:terminal uridylyltransferase 7 n=1 Tax=Rhinatrema bivittatum TaxID=194408 RepID=UPI001127911A|nr:terminal uridylyltransferase 7 [Rhinatrema bivittatum]XP_029472964.1 terminal uridylyltransferase 7 [Rhinatrema bivittatum]XP_029472972.1 terminal uridylyltransferase 7 [Rhinatrema bivittatum]XP_029472983.1 terminal uridylyltransferase 7 [Rhinatrema bivittatum]XP_029472990.1 terminal uridylyltransferase 7 [Rhinatrema bivittatum]XP_029472997.1 terminal uridylyltransferase 7 [Rhinatrema bivittatum]XP_029473003.1 terminal uridylyltransferase 7 [Rhinatrema bivittatum]XP_029473012.1 terminal u
MNQKKPKRPRKMRRDERQPEVDFDSTVIDESALSKKELLGLQQAEDRLRRDCIYRLKRRPRNYPTATYSCKLCDVLVESVTSAHKHIKEKRHKKILKEKQEEELLTTLPLPTLSSIQAIGIAIDKVVQKFGLNHEDVEKRLQIERAMENLIHQKLPDCSLRLYGSSCSRFGFKNSDLNIDIQFPASISQPDVLLLVQESLKNSGSFIDIVTDFHARVPVVICREKQSGLLCKVSAGNENAYLTTIHLAALGRLEPSLTPLVVAFRYWAKLCHIDQPEEGGLPPYVFALMVIFFLQQRKQPLLPVYFGSWIEGFAVRKSVNFNLKMVENNMVLWEYSPAADDKDHRDDETLRRGKSPLVFAVKHPCSTPIGQLWVELLRFYALEFSLSEKVISIRLGTVSRESKDWPKKRIAVEDPYSVKRNVARSLNSQLVYEYILHCLRTTYKYFALPHTKPTKTSKKKLSGTVASQKSEAEKDCSKNDTIDKPLLIELHDINNKLGDLVIDESIGAVDSSQNIHERLPKDTDKVLNNYESPSGEDLVDDIGNVEIALEDSDCVTDEVLFADHEDLESGNEDYEDEEDNDHDVKWQKHFISIDQVLDEDSENGELDTISKINDAETDNISDLESFPNTVMTESDDYSIECCNALDCKVDLDEESTEGTDELEESLNKFLPSEHGQISEMNNSDEEEEDDDEEMSLILNQRQHLDSTTAEEELDNTYTGSGDDVLSEDEREPDNLILATYQELKKQEETVVGEQFNRGDFTEQKDSLNEKGSIHTENCIDSLLFYEFSKFAFTKGKSPTVVCSLCKRDGHLKKDCPEDFKKIELDPLPALTSAYLKILDQVCIQCYKDFSPTVVEDQAREHIRQNLENFIRHEFPGARLSLFGSSKNGFGFIQSDLDICMTLDGVETAEGLDCIKTIEELGRDLKKHMGLRNILPITTAKVPIVKFLHVRSGLEGDISFYNTLGLHNTRLLAFYGAIDPRVKYLCYTMKVFTKMCDIGDASRGSLSSYAYTLMVLYFLQQRKPSVIPVLQEIYEGQKKPEILVDGWNVYFFDKMAELPISWPDYGENKESIGELWLGLLRFYTEEFDFKEHVICIRRKSLLTTFKKQWTSKYIVIEDPFDLNHNLGAGLSRRMTNFIMKAFINGRRVFGTPVKGFPKEYPTKMEYFFDPDVLTEGELAPNDRCCRICGKIGHFMKECPMRRKRRRDNDDAMNQRYQEKRMQRSNEDKDSLNRNMEKEIPAKDGKPSTPQKPRQGKGTLQETGRDQTPRTSAEKWRRQEDRDLREKRCFICGKEGHIKKECPQYKGVIGVSKSDSLCGSPSSSNTLKHAGRVNQVMPLHEEKKKQRGKIFLSPQSGSLSNKYMTQGKASQKRTQQDS